MILYSSRSVHHERINTASTDAAEDDDDDDDAIPKDF
jgi:hypothetical protein